MRRKISKHTPEVTRRSGQSLTSPLLLQKQEGPVLAVGNDIQLAVVMEVADPQAAKRPRGHASMKL